MVGLIHRTVWCHRFTTDNLFLLQKSCPIILKKTWIKHHMFHTWHRLLTNSYPLVEQSGGTVYNHTFPGQNTRKRPKQYSLNKTFWCQFATMTYHLYCFKLSYGIFFALLYIFWYQYIENITETLRVHFTKNTGTRFLFHIVKNKHTPGLFL